MMPPSLRRLVAIALCLVFSAPIVWAKEPPATDSIKPLVWTRPDGEFVTCTAWAHRLDTGRVEWVSAYHCIADDNWQPDPDRALSIVGVPVHYARMSPQLDVVVFTGGPQDVAGLRLAARNPNQGAAVHAYGFPMGHWSLYETQGIVSAPYDDEELTTYNLAVAPGMSGAPVLDAKGRVVGILQQTMCHPIVVFCAMSRGIPFTHLRAAVA